jgi:RibD C-terminal domain
MAKLIYSVITSLDGYVADEDGRFDWSVPDDEVHAVVNDLLRRVGTQLYGRLYEVMVAWETLDLTGESAVTLDFAALWRDSDKVVHSTTLQTVSSARTRLERTFDPTAVAALKASAVRGP